MRLAWAVVVRSTSAPRRLRRIPARHLNPAFGNLLTLEHACHVDYVDTRRSCETVIAAPRPREEKQTMPSRWFVLKDGNRHGPFSTPELRHLVDEGVYTPDAQVSPEGSSEVMTARQALADPDAPETALVSAAPSSSEHVEVTRRAPAPAIATNPPPVHPTEPSSAYAGMAQYIGIHPLVAIATIALDFMLFGGEASTAGFSWVCITLPVAALLVPAAALVQRHAYGDKWALAWAKALILGILTAIPIPLPAIVVFALGVVGGINKWVHLPGKGPAPRA